MGLLRTLFFILLFYYGFKFLARLFTPFLMKKAKETIQKKASEQFDRQQKQHQEPSVKEGETIIDKKPGNEKESNKSVGEYVNFEEIE